MFFAFILIIGLIVWNILLSLQLKDVRANIPAFKKKMQKKREMSVITPELFVPIQKTLPKKPLTHSDFALEDFLGRKFFSILGIISIILALIFFSIWAFGHGYVGPKGQIAIGIMASLLFLIAGEKFRSQYPNFFVSLSSVGVAGLIATTFIAQNVYGFLSPGQSFFAYVTEVGVGMFLALRYDSRILGNFSIVGGLLAPILIQIVDINVLSLLSFLSILSVAGFFVSTQKKWPEILGILFVGIASFEIWILNMELLKQSPILFLSFLFGLHYLIGSGGIIRCIREKITQKISTIDSQSIFEILLFIFSVLCANILAHFIFKGQNWSHFGFFVLAQGFILWGGAELAKKHGLEIFQKLFLGATLATILFATGWELEAKNAFIFYLTFLVEGVLFCFAYQKTKEFVFQLFGCAALLLSYFAFYDILSVGSSFVAMILFWASLIFSMRNGLNNKFEKVWGFIAFGLASLTVLTWNFGIFDDLWTSETKFLLFILPVLFGSGIAYSSFKTKIGISRLLGAAFLGIVHLYLFFYFIDTFVGEKGGSFLAMLFVLMGSFAVLASYFLFPKEIPSSKTEQDVMTILTLSFSCLNGILWGSLFLDEPFRSAIWTICAVALLTIGIKNNWSYFRYFGIGAFCALIGKLYLFDVWGFVTWMKFVVFGALGVGLLFVSFWYQKNSKK